MSRSATPQNGTGSKKKTKGMTIRDVNANMLENLNRDRKALSRWALHRTGTPTKPFKSKEALQERVNDFFASCPDDIPPTPNQLATALGYSSVASLIRDIKSPTEPEYSAILETAYETVKDGILREMLRMSFLRSDFRGYNEALKYVQTEEEKIEGLQPMGGGTTIGGDVNIQINMEKKDRLSALIEESIGSVIDVTADVVTDAKEVKKSGGKA